MHHHRSISI